MKTRLPLTLELATPVLVAELPSDFDPKTQLSSATKSTQHSSTKNFLGLIADVAADVQIDDVIA